MQALPPENTPELKAYFDFFLGTLGFTPNSVLTMQRKPKLVMAFAQLNGAVMDPAGEVDQGFIPIFNRSENKARSRRQCFSTARQSNAVIAFIGNRKQAADWPCGEQGVGLPVLPGPHAAGCA
jgi:hypothetical protein